MAGSSCARPVLSPEEAAAERIYCLVISGRMGRDEYRRRMNALDATPAGVVGTCYCSWLLMHHLPLCPERGEHMATMCQRLRAATCELDCLLACVNASA